MIALSFSDAVARRDMVCFDAGRGASALHLLCWCNPADAIGAGNMIRLRILGWRALGRWSMRRLEGHAVVVSPGCIPPSPP